MDKTQDDLSPAPVEEGPSVVKEITADKAERGGKKKAGGTKTDSSKRSDKTTGEANPKLRGSPRESEEMRMSKTLTWVLRHGSQSEKLTMRPDGYVRVQDIVSTFIASFSPRTLMYEESSLPDRGSRNSTCRL